MPTSYVIRRNDFHVWQLDEVIEKCLCLKYGYFSYKNAWIAFIHTPEPCDAHFIMDARFLFDILWILEQKAPTHCNDNAWKSQDNF